MLVDRALNAFADELVFPERTAPRVRGEARGDVAALWKQIAPLISPRGGYCLAFAGFWRGCGTTRTVAALGLLASELPRGPRIVMVEPPGTNGLAGALGMGVSPGLQDVLAGTVSLTDALRPVGERLSILSGGATAAEKELRRLGKVIEQLRGGHDLLLADACSAADGAPGTPLMRLADGAIVVAGEDDARDATAWCRELSRAGVRVLGLTLTGCRHERSVGGI